MLLRDGGQGREMAVAVTEFKTLDVARAGLHCIADRTRAGAGKGGLAVLLPRLVKRLEPRCRESIAGLIEPPVQIVAPRRGGMRSNLLEVLQHIDALITLG